MRSSFRDKLRDFLGFVALVLVIGVAFLPTPAAFALDDTSERPAMNERANIPDLQTIANENETAAVGRSHERIINSQSDVLAAALSTSPLEVDKDYRSTRQGWDLGPDHSAPTYDGPSHGGVPCARQDGGSCVGARDLPGAVVPRRRGRDVWAGRVIPPGFAVRLVVSS